MSNLFYPGNKSFPEIDFQFDKHILNISGESFPENPNEFWDPILIEVSHYLQEVDANATIVVNYGLRYFGSSTVAKLYSLFRMLNNKACDLNKIMLNWRHDEDDDASRELGEDIADAFKAIDCRLISQVQVWE